MSIKYFKFPYKEVLNFLRTSESIDLNNLYDTYNIVGEDEEYKLQQLADTISDDDLSAYGFEPSDSEEDIEDEEIEDFNQYSDIDDIVLFLEKELDDYDLKALMNKYDCYTVEDLAIVLTDAELESLGYADLESIEDEEDINELEFDEIPCFGNCYVEDLDYIEDVDKSIPLMFIKSTDDGDMFITDDDLDFNKIKESLDTNLVDTCEELGKDEDGHVVFNIKKHEYPVDEEVVIETELNPNLFDSEHKLLPDVKEQLINYVDGFINQIDNEDIKINYSDIVLVGSNAGYLYTPESDIDIHIISDKQVDLDNAEELFNKFDLYEDENPLMIGNAKVELGLEDGYDIALDNKDARRYSLLTDEWLNNSDKFEEFKPEDIHKVDGYEDIVNDYTEKINNVVDNDNYNEASILKQEIRQNRSDDLANIGSLSMGNVVFKELRNNGSYGKLRDYLLYKSIVGDNQNE